MGGQINTVTVAGLGPLELGDYVHSSLRSTVQFATTQAATLNFFQNSIGSTMQGTASTALTSYDTNIPDQGKLPPGWQALIFFMSVYPAPAIVLGDIRDIQNKALFKLILGTTDKVSDDGAAYRYPAGGGVYGVSDLTSVENWTNGLPSSGARTPYAIPHSIKELIPFRCEVSFASALATAAVRNYQVSLEGIIRKPVG